MNYIFVLLYYVIIICADFFWQQENILHVKINFKKITAIE
jgi:hypothetical protein